MTEQYKDPIETPNKVPEHLRLLRYAGESENIIRMKNMIMDLERRVSELESRLSRQDSELKTARDVARSALRKAR
jgi:hypothetical protein